MVSASGPRHRLLQGRGGEAWADIFLPDVQHKNGEINLLNKD